MEQALKTRKQIRVSYRIDDPIAWGQAFAANIEPQRQAGIDVFKAKWRASPGNRAFPYKVTLHANVKNRAEAEAFMAIPVWLKEGVTVGMDISSIRHFWYG